MSVLNVKPFAGGSLAKGAKWLRGGRWDAVLTLGSEGFVTALRLVLLRLAATQWSHDSFGAFVTARRSVNYLYLPALCGMGLALTHAIASSLGRRERDFERYVLAAFGVVLASLAVGWSVGGLFAQSLASLLFGSATETPLLRSVGVAASGLALHGLAYGFLRGQMRMLSANLLQFLMIGLAPVLLLFTPGSSPESVLWWSGVIESAAAIAVLGVNLLRAHPGDFRRLLPSQDDVRQLARYGLPRVPGEFALGALFAVPVTITARNAGLAQAGVMGVCMSLMALIGGLFAPIGQVLIPRIAGYTARGEVNRFHSDRKRLTVVALSAGLIVGVIAVAAAPFAVSILAPWARSSGSTVARIVALGALPYVVHILLRGMLDGVTERALNARNLILSVAVLFGVSALNSSANGVAVGLVLSLWLLGVTTLIDCWVVPSTVFGPRSS